ncbi:MAG: hypothetical protein HS115_18290 [Spirochaetales bacterium]|nr:hypothetical protein [Spirochaetales bacterium]
MFQKILRVLFLYFSVSGLAVFALPPQEEPGLLRVVLIVLDGVRTEEFFGGTDPDLAREHGVLPRTRESIFPFLWQEMAPRSSVLSGNIHARERACYVSNKQRISLPSYADLLAGFRQSNVVSNRFRGKVKNATIIDRLLEESLLPHEVAVFASWKHIEHITSKSHNNFHLETGPLAGGSSVPWANARADRDLFLTVINYVRTHSPLRFLFIALNDADEWAHLNRYDRYLEAMSEQDEYIRQIVYTLEGHPAYQGNTLYLITTDHGRGRGKAWMHHGQYEGSQYIWALVDAPLTRSLDPALRAYWLEEMASHCSHARMGQMVYSLLEQPAPAALWRREGARVMRQPAHDLFFTDAMP